MEILRSILKHPIKKTLALCLPAIVVFIATLQYQFTTLDEQWMLVKNAAFLESNESVYKAFTEALSGKYYRPILLMSFVLDYRIAGMNPAMFHFTNLLWHLTAVILTYQLLCRFKVKEVTAFFLSLCFSVHPLVLHALVWVPGRNDLMLSVFTLGSVLFLLNFLNTQRIIDLFGHVLLFILALATKETAILLPLLYTLILYYISPVQLKTKWWILAIGFLISISWWFLRKSFVKDQDMFSLNTEVLIRTAGSVIVYLGKAIIPFNLSVFPMPAQFVFWPGMVGVALVIGLLLGRVIENKKTALLGLIFFLLNLIIPVLFSSTSSSKEHYEHRAYLPLFGLLLFFSQCDLKKLLPAAHKIILLLPALFAFISIQRMSIYKNEISFLETAVKEAPDHFLFHVQFGELFFQKGKFNEAIASLTQAHEIRPDRKEILNSRSNCYASIGQYDKAIQDLNSIIDSTTTECVYFLNRSTVYNQIGEVNNAMKDLVVALQLCPDKIPAEFQAEVKYKWTTTELRKIDSLIGIEPIASNFFRRSQLQFSSGNNAEGLHDLKKATELDPDNKEYLNLYLKKSSELKY